MGGLAHSEAAPVRLAGADAALALLLFALMAALYRGTFQARQYGDAALLVQVFMQSLAGDAQWGHVLYIPCAKALARLFTPDAPVEGLRNLSALGGALACGFVYLLARLWGAQRPAATLATLLFGLSPAAWFFATTVEVHTLHAACVGLCAVAAILAPWKHALAAALIVAALLPLLFFSHQSGILLGPGFVLLAQWARVRSAAPAFSPAALWLVVAPLFLAAFVAAIAIAADQLENSVAVFLGSTNNTVQTYDQEIRLRALWDGWILPLGMIVPVLLWAAAERRLRGSTMRVVLGLVGPSLVFFLIWSLPERGGYALPTALFLAAAGAVACEPRTRSRTALAILAVLVQATLGWVALRTYDEPQWRERNELRQRGVSEALPEGGALISLNIHSQYIEYQLHRVREVSLYEIFAIAAQEGIPPERFVERVEPILTPLLDSTQPLAWDREGRHFIAEKAPRFLPLADGLEAWLSARCELEPTLAAPADIVGLRRRPASELRSEEAR